MLEHIFVEVNTTTMKKVLLQCFVIQFKKEMNNETT